MACPPTSGRGVRPFGEPVRTGAPGRPRRRPGRHLDIAPVVKRYVQRRVVDSARRLVEGTPTRVETLRRRSQGNGVINTADIERLKATFRERLASLTRGGRALVRRPLDAFHAAGAPRAGTEPPDGTLVLMTTV